MNTKNYYEILGISHAASDEDIKKAYKKLMKEYHPDINKTKGAEDKAKEITAAYETLSNPAKKEKYEHVILQHEVYNFSVKLEIERMNVLYNFIVNSKTNYHLYEHIEKTIEEIDINMLDRMNYKNLLDIKEKLNILKKEFKKHNFNVKIKK